MSPSLISFLDLKEECDKGRFGPNWTVLLEECVEEHCRGRGLKPQTYGFKGHGSSGWEWDDEDLEEIALNVFTKDIAPRNQHITIIKKASNISQVKGMLKRSITWRLGKDRPRTVNGNVVENLKRMLKENHNITLPVTESNLDPTHIKKLADLKEMFPHPHWRKEGALNRNGEPYTNLPKVFRDSDLEKIAQKISSIDPLPTSGELWSVVGEVLGSKEGTQEFNSELVETLAEAEVETSGSTGLAITGSTEGGTTILEQGPNFSEKLEKLDSGERIRFVELAKALIDQMDSTQRKVIEMVRIAGFSELSRVDIADAIGVEDPSRVSGILMEVANLTQEFVKESELDQDEQELLQWATMFVLNPPRNLPFEIEE
jgi:hypothetical protein